MRLVCPNCEAKYEVPDDAIPESGRDVQCANCGHAWFQMRSRVGGADAEVAPAAVPSAVPVEAPVVRAAAEPEAPIATPSEAPKAKAGPVEAGVAAASALAGNVGRFTGQPASEAAAAPQAKAGPGNAQAAGGVAANPAYAVDDSVLAILREEAEREAEARRAEARPLETQPDLGLDAAMPARQKPVLVASADAALHGMDDAANKPSARRDLLPDVEEINYTLRPSEVPDTGEEGQPLVNQREGRGFRSGFLVVMAIAIIGAGIYLAAPQLSAIVPALAGPLEFFVGAVDSLRLLLDGLMRSATVAINGS